jgi:hypothetical protein
MISRPDAGPCRGKGHQLERQPIPAVSRRAGAERPALTVTVRAFAARARCSAWWPRGLAVAGTAAPAGAAPTPLVTSGGGHSCALMPDRARCAAGAGTPLASSATDRPATATCRCQSVAVDGQLAEAGIRVMDARRIVSGAAERLRERAPGGPDAASPPAGRFLTRSRAGRGGRARRTPAARWAGHPAAEWLCFRRRADAGPARMRAASSGI